MQEPEIIDEHLREETPNPPIYSKVSIFLFSVFFSTFFASFMLGQNFIDIGQRKRYTPMLIFSVLFSIGNYSIGQIYTDLGSKLSIPINILGAVVMTEFFFRGGIPDESVYPKKKIWKPLIIGVSILALAFVILLSQGGLPGY